MSPTLWCLLELKEGSHETGLTGLHVALTGECDPGLGLLWGGGQKLPRQGNVEAPCSHGRNL